ncbi:MAG: type fimbrial biosis protein FimT [Burkholderiales bacterium]
MHGVTLVELAIVMAVLGLLLAMGVPSLTGFIANQRIRGAAHTVLSALQQAREEAVRRNSTVRLSLVNTDTNTCVLSNAGPHIVVSQQNPAGKCAAVPSETNGPQIVKVIRADRESNTSFAARDGNGDPQSSIAFNGFGRVDTSAGGWVSQIDVKMPTVSTVRPLRVRISTAGEIGICDPAARTNDPRSC